MLQELEFGPGVYVDDSALAAKGRYVASNGIRFVRGKPQTRYGNEKFSTTALTGYARGIHAWKNSSAAPYLAVGTHLRLYAADADGTQTDITPVTTYTAQSSISFTTVVSSTTVTITGWTHGLAVNQKFDLLTSSVSAVGGVTLAATGLVVLTVESATSITYTAASAATSSAGPTASTVDIAIYLAPGLSDGAAGVGYGTGSFGSGGYGGSSSSTTLYPGTWSFADWGNNLIANRRGGPTFEWAVNTSASELVGDSAFTASTSWTVGTGWSVGGNNANASSTSSNLTQSITLNAGAWHLLRVQCTISSGTLRVYDGSITIQTCSATNHFYQPFWGGAGGSVVLKLEGSAFTGNVTLASVKVLTTGAQITSAPNPATCIFSTSERILVACGVNDDNSNFDPMRVRWSDQQANQTWTAAASNLAGQYPLTNGSRIVRGIAAASENLIFTDKTVYAMRYVPDPNVVYDFVDIGNGAGLIGPNAVAVINGAVYWKAPNGQDYMYNGGTPVPITSNTMRRDFNDNVAWVQQDKIFSAPIGAWNEIIHHYPDSRDGTECSRYNKYNFAEDCWDQGLASITCWLDQGIFQYPIAVDTSGYIRYMEKGNSVDGGAFSWSITSAKVRQENGYKNMTINGVELDAAGLMGGYQLTALATWKDIRGVHTKTFGPYNANANSGSIPVHAKGQFLQLTWSSTVASPTFWRGGSDLFDLTSSGGSR